MKNRLPAPAPLVRNINAAILMDDEANTQSGDDMAKKDNEKEIKERIDEFKKLADAEDWQALEEAAERFIKDYPEHAAGYFFRGISRSEQGNLEESLEDINTAIDIEPTADAYNNRGKIHIARGAFDEALTDFDKAIDIEPNNTLFHQNRGIALANQTSKQTHKSMTNLIQYLINNTKAELKTVTEERLEEITNPQKIIEQFDKDINQSHYRLYGYPETPDEENKEKQSFQTRKGSLNYKADKAADRLRFCIVGIVAIVSFLFVVDYFSMIEIYCYFDDICEIPRRHMPQAEQSITAMIALAVRYSLILIILTGAFFAYARRANREYKEELNRYFALKRDRNIMLYWTAIEKVQKKEHAATMFTHFSNNSVADLSFQMFDPKLARQRAKSDDTDSGFFWQRRGKDSKRLDDMEKQLEQILDTIKEVSKNQ